MREAYHQKNTIDATITAGRTGVSTSPTEYCHAKLTTAATREIANAVVARRERTSISPAPMNALHPPIAQAAVAQAGAPSMIASRSGPICPIHEGSRSCVIV